jgi:hypothetical protein
VGLGSRAAIPALALRSQTDTPSDSLSLPTPERTRECCSTHSPPEPMLSASGGPVAGGAAAAWAVEALGAGGDRMVHGRPEETSAGVEWHRRWLRLACAVGGAGLEGVAAWSGRSPGELPANPGVARVRGAQASGSPAGPAVGALSTGGPPPTPGAAARRRDLLCWSRETSERRPGSRRPSGHVHDQVTGTMTFPTSPILRAACARAFSSRRRPTHSSGSLS